LQVHTPGSYDYEANISATEFVDYLVKEGLELVVVTDHDCAGMYEEILEAAEERLIEILPGVEITTPQGGENQIHMTAIFPPEEHDAVNHVLSQVGINPERVGEGQADSRVQVFHPGSKNRRSWKSPTSKRIPSTFQSRRWRTAALLRT
jgi:predicted metal-dependent phosphoesterase TrpH